MDKVSIPIQRARPITALGAWILAVDDLLTDKGGFSAATLAEAAGVSIAAVNGAVRPAGRCGRKVAGRLAAITGLEPEAIRAMDAAPAWEVTIPAWVGVRRGGWPAWTAGAGAPANGL